MSIIRFDEGFSDFARGLGGRRDAIAGMATGHPYHYSRQQLENYFVNLFPVRRACTALPGLALQKKGRLTLGGEEAPELNSQLSMLFSGNRVEVGDRPLGLDVWTYFRKAQITANIHGGAGIVLLANDGNADNFERPLDTKKLKEIWGLRLFDRWDLYPDPEDYSDGAIGAEYYYLGAGRMRDARGRLIYPGLKVHSSRVLPFYGDELTEYSSDVVSDGWHGDSKVRQVIDATKAYLSSNHTAAHALQSFEVFHVQIRELYEKIAGDTASENDPNRGAYEKALQSRADALLAMLSTYNMLVTDADQEEASFLQRRFQGVKEILEALEEYLVAATGLPRSLLFHRYGSQLGQMGEHEQQAIGQLVASQQEEKFQANVETLLGYLLASDKGPAKGDAPKLWGWEWYPSHEPTDKELAETRKIDAETAAAHIDKGVLSAADVRESYFGGSKYTREITLQEEPEEEKSAPSGEEEKDPAPAPAPAPEENEKNDKSDRQLDLFENVSRSDEETFKPPESVAANARKVLEWREKYGDEVKGMTRVGWTRANQLAKRENLTLETVKRIAAFERHRGNAKVEEEHEGEPWKDAGRVAWLGWGGDEGIAWAKRIVEREEKGDRFDELAAIAPASAIEHPIVKKFPTREREWGEEELSLAKRAIAFLEAIS